MESIKLHQTHHTIADFEAIKQTLLEILKSETQTPTLHLFPELFLTGYPLNDLCQQASFIQRYLSFLAELQHEIKNLPSGQNRALVGGLHYEFHNDKLIHIKNQILEITPAVGIKGVYTKRLLPNYDIFDEKRYFTAGESVGIYRWQEKDFALLICEDMWASEFENCHPVRDLYQHVQQNKLQLSGIINLSASPFNYLKQSLRLEQAQKISSLFQSPFFYANRVGGEDEILFDGQSFVIADNELMVAKQFSADTLEFALKKQTNASTAASFSLSEHSFENLFEANLDNSSPAQIKEHSEAELASIHSALLFGMQEYARKTYHETFTLALSGGIDSSLVLTLMRQAFPNAAIEAIYMPSHYSSELSRELSIQLCQNLDVTFREIDIHDFLQVAEKKFEKDCQLKLAGLGRENIQSRLRGTLLYTHSNLTKSLVFNTSNKSEIAVGYSTQYGDSVGALSILGDLYKTQVYQLSNYINSQFSQLIPEQIITRPPTAELRENQKDEDSLPPYPILDALLEGFLSYQLSSTDLINRGFEKETVHQVAKLLSVAEYKRFQFCPIVKVSPKSFGYGYRNPIVKNSSFYLS